jgi:predicted Zn-dependent protease with MMP-like domain
MKSHKRWLFDTLLEEVLAELPEHVAAMLDEVAIIVEDEPDEELLEELGMLGETNEDEAEELYGLHTGTPLTDRGIEDNATLPDEIHLFRGPLLRLAEGDVDELRRQIRITLLHEIGHHFGLDEDDLARLGYD